MDKPIARLPEYVDSEEWCCSCGDDNVLVTLEAVAGGDKITLCSKCYARMQIELGKLNLGV